MTGINAGDQAIISTNEWQTYIQDPSRENFWAIAALTNNDPVKRNQLLVALISLWSQGRNWRIAQHAALLADSSRQTTLANLLSVRALRDSNGNPKARLSLARVYWGRRLSAAAIGECQIIRQQNRREKRRPDRHAMQAEVANLMSRAYAYLGNLDAACRWFTLLRHRGHTEIETLIYLLFLARNQEARPLQAYISLLLAPHSESLGARPRATVRTSIHRALIELLKRRR